jgi:hypothetical protein
MLVDSMRNCMTQADLWKCEKIQYRKGNGSNPHKAGKGEAKI